MDTSSSDSDSNLESSEEEPEMLVLERRGDKLKFCARYSDDRTTKWLKEDVDRISGLPDSVITHILSLVTTTRDAVRTSALSKRWRDIWASTSALVYLDPWKSLEGFTKFVDRTLILHSSPKIHKFVLESRYASCMESSVSLWIHAMAMRQVEELSIKLADPRCTFLLPQRLYSCDSLTRLSLTCIRFAPRYSPVCWQSLRHLTLTCATFDDNVIRHILAGSPLLESLELKDCGRFDRIATNSKTLSRLVIDGYDRKIEDHDWLDIHAPGLQSLEILGAMQWKRCRLENVPSLFHANLTFHLNSIYMDDEDEEFYETTAQDYQEMVRDLIEKVHHVQNLTIGTWVVQVLSVCVLKDFPFSISARKCLTLEIGLDDADLPGSASLLRTSPILERFVIDVSDDHTDEIGNFVELYNFSGRNYWISFDNVSQCLKDVEIIGFAPDMTELAEFLLKNAKALEKMVFTKRRGTNEHWEQYFDGNGNFEVMQRLLSLPRSSAQAQILWWPNF